MQRSTLRPPSVSAFILAFLLTTLTSGPGSAQDAAGPASGEHPLTRQAASLDLEGNVVPGAYTMAIEVGTPPRTFEVVADTGSSNLILLGDSSLCDNCAQVPGQAVYDPGQSSTAQLSDTGFTIHYGSGSLEARYVRDQVSVGNLPPIDYKFGVMTHQAGIHNILGLAFKAQARPLNAPLTPYFDELVSQGGIANEFSMLLCPEGESKITLGATNATVDHYIDLVEESWYVVAPKKMQVEGGKSLGRFRGTVVIDSGTTELLVSAKMQARIIKALTPVATKNSIDLKKEIFQASPEVMDQFPVLQIVASDTTGQPITLDISPHVYFRKLGTVDHMLAIRPTNTDEIILGQVFMENRLVVFDRANKRIGFGSGVSCN